VSDCLSPHLPLPQSGAVQLRWFPPFSTGRVWVRAWTCSCRAVVYELCETGGQAFIRRIVQCEPTPVVLETHRWSSRRGREMWAAVLCGRAR